MNITGYSLHPLAGFGRPSSASRTKMAPSETRDVIMTLVSYFCGLPVGTIGPVSPSKWQFVETMWRHSLLMPPGIRQRTRWHVYLQLQMCWERAGTQARSHGGGRGGLSPPWKNLSPPSRPRLPALTFYRYRYWGLFPPPGILSAPPPY